MSSTQTKFQQRALIAYLEKSPLHQAAIKAGVSRYPVPVCGGGFTGHHRATTTGRCVDCARLDYLKAKERAAAKATAQAAATTTNR